MTLATTKTGEETGSTGDIMKSVFLPIVKPALLDEFKTVWGDVLVLTDAVEDQKKPGKLKIEFFSRDGEMVALAPKSYFAFCRETQNTKEGKKGIPLWFQLRIDDLKKTLYSEERNEDKIEIRSLRLNKNKQMSRTTTIRRGLTGIHVKLGVEADKVRCCPLKINGEFV